MGLWGSHRDRQAGKFAKANYQLAASQQQAEWLQLLHDKEQERRKYWFDQGWHAAYGKAHVLARNDEEYQLFLQGWHSAQSNRKQIEQGAEVPT